MEEIKINEREFIVFLKTLLLCVIFMLLRKNKFRMKAEDAIKINANNDVLDWVSGI